MFEGNMLPLSSTLMMKVVHSSKLMIPTYKTTQRKNPESKSEHDNELHRFRTHVKYSTSVQNSALNFIFSSLIYIQYIFSVEFLKIKTTVTMLFIFSGTFSYTLSTGQLFHLQTEQHNVLRYVHRNAFVPNEFCTLLCIFPQKNSMLLSKSDLWEFIL